MAGEKKRERPAAEPVQLPWWLDGDQTCGACYQRYSLELECRCHHCDEPLCPHCVVTVRETQKVLCQGCAEQQR